MICYQIFIRSFADSNGDGIGDLNGIISKLDYLEWLGVEGIWLTPFHPSPSYHKYDVTNYFEIDNEYGTMSDFHRLIEKCHRKNIKVILDLVLNHTSEQHPLFKEAALSMKSKYRNWFVWNEKKKLSEPKNLWHPSPLKKDKQFYYGYFWKGMPDLNYENKEVRQQAVDIARFWLKKGADGFRLDAAKHIFPPEREEANHNWWKEFRSELEKIKPEVYLVGEVADTCEVITPYLQNGLTCCFNFQLAEKIIEAINSEKNNHIAEWLNTIYALYKSQSPKFQDAIFLSNHDLDRIASQLHGNIEKLKLAANILFTLPGDVYIYYGEELGMYGKKPDEHIREPFLWNNSGHDPSVCKWIEPVYSTSTNLEDVMLQQTNNQSLLIHYKSLIAFRKKKFSNLTLALNPVSTHPGILSYYILSGTKKYLVLHNITHSTVCLNTIHVRKGSYYYLSKPVFDKNNCLLLPAFKSCVHLVS